MSSIQSGPNLPQSHSLFTFIEDRTGHCLHTGPLASCEEARLYLMFVLNCNDSKKEWLRNEGWVVPLKGKIRAKTSRGYFISRLGLTTKRQYVARKILKFLISEGKLWHN